MQHMKLITGMTLALLSIAFPRTSFAGIATRDFHATVTDNFTQGAPSKLGMPVHISGRGTANDLGTLLEVGSGRLTDIAYGLAERYTETLTFRDGSILRVRITGTEKFTHQMAQVQRRARFTFTGGAGRFRRATGMGTITANCPNDPNSAVLTCTNTWKGTVKY
jgi:hypothetical protein